MKCDSRQKPLVVGVLLAMSAIGVQANDRVEDSATVSVVENEKMLVEGSTLTRYAEYLPTSGTKSDVDWLEVTQAVSVVTHAEIKDRGAVRLVEALQGVAGVNNTLGEGSRDQFVIRGFDALNDLYRDGLRDDGTLQSYRSLANIERVEVVKGPAGALYGRGSAGGMINLITKRALGGDFTRVTGQVGSDGLRVGRVDSSAKLSEAVNARVNLEYKESDSFVDHVDSHDFFIAPTVRLQPSEQHIIDLDLEVAHQALTPYRGVPSQDGRPVAVSSSTYFGATNDYQESDSVRLALTHEMQINPDLKWVNRAAWNRIELEQKGTRQGVVSADVVAQSVNNFGYDPRTTTTLQSELVWASGDNQLLAGVDFNEIAIDLVYARDKTITGQNIYAPTVRETPDPGFAPWRKNITETLGVYVQNVHQFGDLSVMANARFDRMDLEQERVGMEKEYLDDNKLSYRLGATYRISEDVSLYATGARSWQLPWSGIFVRATQAELFHSDLMELGAKGYLLNDALMLNAALFRIEQALPTTNTAGEIVAKQEVRHQGVELEVRGELNPRWNVAASYSYLKAEDVATGFKPNDVSDHLFSFWSTYQLDAHWKLGGGIKHVGARYAGNNEQVKLDAYTLVDLMAEYRFRDHAVQLNVQNLFDETYALGATNGSSGRNQIGFGAPLQLQLSYNYRF